VHAGREWALPVRHPRSGCGDEAETFQSVGVRLRECLITFVGERRREDLVPEGQAAPKGADSELGQTCWRTSWLPATGRQGSVVPQEERRRDLGVLKWLTYAKNAVRMDAEIGMKVVEHLLGVFTAARLRHDVPATRCADCGSYRVVGGVCEHCNGVAPRARRWTKAERTRRLAEPRTPSSDISTFMSPKDFARK
jgi:hypothetical protein